MKYFMFVCLFVSASLIAPASAQQSVQQQGGQQQSLKQINQLLSENPEVIPSVLDSLKAYVENKAAAAQRSQEHGPWLFDNDSAHPWFGAEDAELAILVFTDYDCPFCKRLEPHLQKLVVNYAQLKVINVMVPLRQQNVSGGQLNPASYAINVWQNQRAQFAEVHELLYAKNGLHTQRSLEQIARTTGTRSQLSSANATPTILQRNYQVFTDFQLRGTPAIIINGQIIPGYVEYEDLEKLVVEALK